PPSNRVGWNTDISKQSATPAWAHRHRLVLCVSVTLWSISPLLPHQRSGQHVVQSLLALSEPDHDVADAQDHSRKPLREMPSGGARKRDAVAVKISDLHPENHLAERRLVGGAQHESFVEPGAEEYQHQHDTTTEQMQ